MIRIFTFLLLLNPSFLFAQDMEDDAAARAVIAKLFDGMRAGDSTMVRSVFHPTATMQSAFTDKNGEPVLRSGSVDSFVEAVGTPHDEVWDEKIWAVDIFIDGRLASIWTDYTFFLGEKMSHCGVNAFQLFNGENGWQIIHITDTRTKDGCREQ